jgi:hypothetical protein
MTAEQFRVWIAPVSQLVAVIVVAGTIIVWGFRLSDRVDRLETQLQAILTTAPSQSPSSGSGSGSNPPSTSNTPASPSAGPSVSAACANLAERAAASAQNSTGPSNAVKEIKQLMTDMGCMLKALPNSN